MNMERFENQNGEKVSAEKLAYLEVHSKLKGIIRDMTSIDKELRKTVFDRMLHGPELTTDNPELMPFFEAVAAVEDAHGQEYVKEMATFYVSEVEPK